MDIKDFRNETLVIFNGVTNNKLPEDKTGKQAVECLIPLHVETESLKKILNDIYTAYKMSAENVNKSTQEEYFDWWKISIGNPFYQKYTGETNVSIAARKLFVWMTDILWDSVIKPAITREI